MGKKLFSLCMALALCLGLLPATALAADEDAPDTLLVSGTDVKNGGYWTTNNGTLTSSDESSWNVHYDTSTNTLTLNSATITGVYSENAQHNTVGIYASSSGNVSLEIELQGENTITSDGNGIYVYSPENGGNASLTITGEDSGSLDANCKNNAIIVQGNSDDAALSIQGAEVEATVDSSAGHGVMVQAGSNSSASLSVDRGSLTATGSGSSCLGIYFYSPSPSNINLNVNNNAIVRANGGIASGTNLEEDVSTSGTGIVFDDNEGTVYGKVELQEDLEIGEGETLTIPEGSTLTVPEGKTITVESGGKLDGKPTGNGTVIDKSSPISYLDEDGTEKNCNDYEVVTANDTQWTAGWYVAQGDITIDQPVTVSDNVYLILEDGCNLTVICTSMRSPPRKKRWAL